LDAAGFEGSEQREVVLRPGTPKERRIVGQAYLMAYGLPQFFFHVTTAYNLLRHNGDRQERLHGRVLMADAVNVTPFVAY